MPFREGGAVEIGAVHGATARPGSDVAVGPSQVGGGRSAARRLDGGAARSRPDPAELDERRMTPGPRASLGRAFDVGPAAARALAAAFGGAAPARQDAGRSDASRIEPRPLAVPGPFVVASDLDEAGERRWLAATGEDVVVLPYGPLDPTRPPLLLVHGFNQAPETMRDLAERLTRAGRQVLVAFYADTRRATHESGRLLARALVELRARTYLAGTPLDVVAHSMGGLVTRCALDYLQEPGWLGIGPTIEATPRAGFGPVRVRAIDSPWEGFVPTMPGWVYRFLAWLLELLGFAGVVDMVAQSRMYERLYRPRLEGVGIESVAVHKPGHDWLRTLPEVEPDELREIVDLIETGALPPSTRARNLAGSLAQDERYDALVSALRERRAGPTQADGGAAALVAAFEAVMPALDGDHTRILRDDPADARDLVDRLVAELGTPRGG